MSALSKILRDAEGGLLMFWCPGCKEAHGVRISGDGPRWGWNGDVEKPTFTPSILVRGGHYVSTHKPGDKCWCTYNAEHPDRPSRFGCSQCHSFVADGRIQFLGDCSHDLAGLTVDIPPFDQD